MITNKNTTNNKKGRHPYISKAKRKAVIYIGNLHYKINEKDLMGIFGQYGKVGKVNLVTENDKSKGIAFVEMFDTKCINKAVASLNGKSIDGRVAKVSIAQERNSEQLKNQKPIKVREEKVKKLDKLEIVAVIKKRRRKTGLQELFSNLEMLKSKKSR